MAFDFKTHPFTSKLQNVKQSGINKWLASCPCTASHKHGDKKRSLSIRFDPQTENLLINCFTGCSASEIVSSVNCTLADLFTGERGTKKNSLMQTVNWYANKNSFRLSAIYPYGDGLFKVKFYDSEGEKTFRWIHEDPAKTAGFSWNHEGFSPRLYVAGNLEDQQIILTEGEKDADTVNLLTGLTAVSAENGATARGDAGSKWHEAYTTQLAGKDVLILWDNDGAGKHFAKIEAERILSAANSVKLLDLLSVWPDCSDGGDISDFAGQVGNEEAIEKFFQMVSKAEQIYSVDDAEKLINANSTQVPGAKVITTPGASTTEQKKMTPEEIAKALMKNLSDVQLQGKRYIFKPYLPVGKFSILNADPGVGKTKVASAIAALVTTGSPLLGIKCERPGKVLLFSIEDDAEDFLHTVTACGGDASKITVIGDDDESLKLLKKHKLTYDSQIVEEMIKLVQPSLVVFDPYQKYLPRGVDMNRANELSDALASVVRLAKQYDCHIMIVGHNTKAQTGLSYKFMGSQDFLGEARSGLSVVRDPERVKEQENLILHVKSNNKTGKAIRYRIESIPGNEDYARVEWLGLEDYTEADYAKSQRKKLREIDGEKSPLSVDNPVVQTVFALLHDNPDGVAVGYEDFKNAKEAVTGSAADIRIETEIGKVSAWLDSEFGIGVACRYSNTIKPYYLKGNLQIPTKNKDRQVIIRRNRIVDIQQQKIVEVLKP